MSTPLPILPQRSPHIPRPIDNTALDDYMKCPRKYYYAHVLNRRGRVGQGLSPALAYGTCWHAIMEAHYKTGGNIQAVTDAAVRAWQPHNDPEDHRTLERCVSAYDGYLKQWGDHDQEMAGWGQTVGYPGPNPVVELALENWWPGALHTYTGKIDRIYTHAGLYYVEDHKTTSAVGTTYFRQWDPSNQMMGYAWLAQLQSGLPIAGVRINVHGVLKTQNKFERQTIMFSQERLKEWAENYNWWIRRLEESYQMTWATTEIDDKERPLRNNDHLAAWPHQFNACAGKFGQCAYTEVCTYDAHIRPKILEAEYEENPWNPLKPEDGE